MIVTKNPDIVGRVIHDRYYLIDITQNYLDNRCRLYELNEIGYFIWEQLNHSDCAEDIADELFKAVVGEVSKDVIYEDVKEYLDILEKEGFIKYGRDQ